MTNIFVEILNKIAFMWLLLLQTNRSLNCNIIHTFIDCMR